MQAHGCPCLKYGDYIPSPSVALASRFVSCPVEIGVVLYELLTQQKALSELFYLRAMSPSASSSIFAVTRSLLLNAAIAQHITTR